MFVVTRQRHDSLVLTLPNEIVTQPFLVVKILDVLPGGIKMGVEAPREVGLDRKSSSIKRGSNTSPSRITFSSCSKHMDAKDTDGYIPMGTSRR